MGTLNLKVSGMTCGGCAKSIENALTKLPQVEAAKVDFATATATVTGQVTKAEVTVLLDNLGFEVVDEA